MPGGGVYYRGRFHLVYVDMYHIAALRGVQGEDDPDPVKFAMKCVQSGCDGITVRMSKDGHSMNEEDVSSIRERIQGNLNIETTLSDDFMDFTERVTPDKIVFVPENRGETTAKAGLDARNRLPEIKDAVKLLHDRNILVSLSVAPCLESVEQVKNCGADFCQIHTGAYGKAAGEAERERELGRIYRAAKHAVKVGLKVSAGHGLNYSNILPVLIARAMEEVSIGHAIISRAVFVGLSRAVEEMLEILE